MTQQLSLLPPIELETTLSIVPVPSDVAIAKNRFYLEARNTRQHWHLGIQLTAAEANFMLARLAGLNWTLDDDGIPIDAAIIHQFAEVAIDGRLAEQAVQWGLAS